jgi:ATP-dependent Clp protease ATP-binding subunit ClpC
MFERYNERARRVVFFARFEASQYGSHVIETEHLLLGLVRENGGLIPRIPGEKAVGQRIRTEIEQRITRGQPIATSVELPLSSESKKVLTLAAETAERVGDRHIDPGHLLVGLLRVETSMAAQILRARGLAAETVQFELAKAQSPQFEPGQEPTDFRLSIVFSLGSSR